VGRAVLVHIGPHIHSTNVFDLAAARRIFSNIEIGSDGQELEI
jgi:hypothetical protein